MNRIFAAVCASVAAVSGASAQDGPVSNPTAMIADFDPSLIGPVLNELGIVWRQFEADNGQPYIDANYRGEFLFRLLPTACQTPGYKDCVGLSMTAVFDGRANPQTVTAFNYLYSFASVGLTPQGEAFIVRYDIADYGVPRGNVASSVLNFISQAFKLRDELASARQTVAQQGYSEDFSAAYMNRLTLDAMAGGRAIPTGTAELHRQAMEETAANIRAFIADKSMRRNKIQNIFRD
jgi:hypothetical protein